MILAYPDALAAVYASLLVYDRFMISDPDRLGRTTLDAVYAPLAQVRIQSHRVGKYSFIAQNITPYYPYC